LSSVWSRFLVIASAATASLLAAVPVGATTVQPVLVDLASAGRKSSATVEVQNDFKTKLPVELRVEGAQFVDGELVDTNKPSDDLLIFPPSALIEPGRTQTFRIQYLGDPALAESKHYFVTVAQLPVAFSGQKSELQVLYDFQVVTGVKPLGGKPAIKIAKAEVAAGKDGKYRAVLMLENTSNTYGYLSSGTVKLRLKDAQGKVIYQKSLNPIQVQDQIGYGMVGAHQKRRLATQLVLPGNGVLEAEFLP